MPAFNTEKYISKAIESVLKQSYSNWELLIVNDGSNDRTREISLSFNDERIQYFEQDNKGVSAARNIGLAHMTGDYFCFLDSDDLYSANSLKARLSVFECNPRISFVDGTVIYVDENLVSSGKHYRPRFKGQPYAKLLQLDSNCFFGSTWMIKRELNQIYEFDESMSHCEDLFFYLTISNDKEYDFTDEIILSYRQRNDSAMRNLISLENGYILLIKKIKSRINQRFLTILVLKLTIAKVMTLSHLFDGNDILSAIKCPFKIFSA